MPGPDFNLVIQILVVAHLVLTAVAIASFLLVIALLFRLTAAAERLTAACVNLLGAYASRIDRERPQP